MKNSMSLYHSRYIAILLLFVLSLSAQSISWTSVNNGLTGVAVYNVKDLAVNSSDELFAATAGQGVFVSTNSGDNWIQRNNGLTDLNVWCVAINPADEVFVGTQSEGIFKSDDKGENWTKLELELTFNFVRDIIVCENSYVFAAVEFEGIIRSVNNGNSWSHVNNGLTGGGGKLSLYQDLAGQILAGTTFGRVYFSNSYGDGWTQSSAGLPNTTTAPVLTIIENEDEKYFAGTGEGLYRSTDYGHNWSQVHDGGGNGYVHSLTIDISDNVYIGTGNSGVFVSSNGRDNWQQINSGLTHLGVYSLVVDSVGNLFATTGEGIFKSTQTTDIENNDKLELDFSLEQNYPNPFNPITKISFSIPNNTLQELSQNVKLSVYNALGQLVATLVNEFKNPGLYEVEFNSGNLTSGIYFYKLEYSNLSQTRKMVLLK